MERNCLPILGLKPTKKLIIEVFRHRQTPTIRAIPRDREAMSEQCRTYPVAIGLVAILHERMAAVAIAIGELDCVFVAHFCGLIVCRPVG